MNLRVKIRRKVVKGRNRVRAITVVIVAVANPKTAVPVLIQKTNDADEEKNAKAAKRKNPQTKNEDAVAANIQVLPPPQAAAAIPAHPHQKVAAVPTPAQRHQTIHVTNLSPTIPPTKMTMMTST